MPMQSLEVPETPFSGGELQESPDGTDDAKDSSSQHTSPSGKLSGLPSTLFLNVQAAFIGETKTHDRVSSLWTVD